MTLTSLIGRLENARGADRELDADIWRFVGGKCNLIEEVGGHTHVRWLDAELVRWREDQTRFTASIDAALALVEQVLPGWDGELVATRGLQGERVWTFRLLVTRRSYADAPTAPLAILIALCRALGASHD